MTILVNERSEMILEEVYDSILLKTPEGNTFQIRMQDGDGTIEMTIAGSNKWYKANMDTGEIELM